MRIFLFRHLHYGVNFYVHVTIKTNSGDIVPDTHNWQFFFLLFARVAKENVAHHLDTMLERN